MLFFKDVETPCPICRGKRFQEEVLAITYRGYTIDQVLALSIEQALCVFHDNTKIVKTLTMLKSIGLGYLRLSQNMTTLSTGEKQRMKLALELLKNKQKCCLYLLDEPTTGLHPHDIAHLLHMFDTIIEQGNTIVLIEHNLQVIAHSDHIIDLSEGGGDAGGKLIAMGSVQAIQQNSNSSLFGYL